MKWMEKAWSLHGVVETAGDAATPEIVAMFRDAGRPDVMSDEVFWCAAFVGASLHRGGISLDAIPDDERLLARSYLKIGTPIDGPRVGAVCVLKRGGDPRAGHTGLVTGWTETTVTLLNGNVKNCVCVSHFPMGDVLGFRWPEPPATAKDLAAAGSRTIQAVKGQVRDAWLTVGSLSTAAGAKMLEPSTPATAAKTLGRATEVMTQAATLQKFGAFCLSSWPWIAGTLAAWFVVRMLVGAGVIEEARVADHNTGANTARSAGGAA